VNRIQLLLIISKSIAHNFYFNSICSPIRSSSSTHTVRALLCFTFAVFALSACSCKIALPLETSPFIETQVVLCKDVVQGSPISISDSFSEQDQRVCTFVQAKFDDIFSEPLVPGEQVGFAFAWYYEGKVISEKQVTAPMLSDLWVSASDCLDARETPLSPGRYRVIVKHGDFEIEDVEFQVVESP
jgi:hypothetical protein